MSKVESVRISVTLSTFHVCDLQMPGRRKVSLREGEGRRRFLFMEERAIMRHGEEGVSYDKGSLWRNFSSVELGGYLSFGCKCCPRWNLFR